jgi:hypothetical protein
MAYVKFNGLYVANPGTGGSSAGAAWQLALAVPAVLTMVAMAVRSILLGSGGGGGGAGSTNNGGNGGNPTAGIKQVQWYRYCGSGF